MIIAGAHPCNINLNNLDFNFANYVGFENKAFLVTKRRFYIYLAAKCTFTSAGKNCGHGKNCGQAPTMYGICTDASKLNREKQEF